MNNELEKTQLEIARLQLEQERLKLQKMQRRHEAKEILGQGAMAVGAAAAGGAGKAAGAVLGYVGRWVAYATMTAAVLVVLLYWLGGWGLIHEMGFSNALGYQLGYYLEPTATAVVLNATACAFAPLKFFFSTEGGTYDGWVAYLLIIPAAVFGIWYLL